MVDAKTTITSRALMTIMGRRVEKWRAPIITYARFYEHQPSIIAAIITRETGGLDLWCLPPPKGKLGDNGHGHGPMQIDDRSFREWCLNWRRGMYTTEHGIAQGCAVLKLKRDSIKTMIPELPGALLLLASVSAYNCGENRVRRAFRNEQPLDIATTGQNYGHDVIERADYFEKLGYDLDTSS